MESTETLLPTRLATKARSPFLEIDRPEGLLPTVSVSISFGGLAGGRPEADGPSPLGQLDGCPYS